MDYELRRGMQIAPAAAMVVISFGVMISAYLDSSRVIKFMLAAVFVVLSIVAYKRKAHPVLNVSTAAKRSCFFRGFLLAALKPQAIPFWRLALAAISQYPVIHNEGVFTGKLFALLGFLYASTRLNKHLYDCSRIINRELAAILLLMRIGQLRNAF